MLRGGRAVGCGRRLVVLFSRPKHSVADLLVAELVSSGCPSGESPRSCISLWNAHFGSIFPFRELSCTERHARVTPLSFTQAALFCGSDGSDGHRAGPGRLGGRGNGCRCRRALRMSFGRRCQHWQRRIRSVPPRRRSGRSQRVDRKLPRRVRTGARTCCSPPRREVRPERAAAATAIGGVFGLPEGSAPTLPAAIPFTVLCPRAPRPLLGRRDTRVRFDSGAIGSCLAGLHAPPCGSERSPVGYALRPFAAAAGAARG